ncbi:MAG: methionyl-tRNA formyltransferase [Planctomycetes bacterium TMED75]|nr:methionyl-tRNA formyltransferase [Planctomycetaceae bacterium]OUU96864.1 MAG: methionyl-tRNA formyltransferase [Planctomycetes bacterium TMED75]
MRLVFLGSGSFGLPTLRALASEHEVLLVVSQPDRPAGRSRRLTATPIAQWAQAQGLPVRRPEDVNTPDSVTEIRGTRPDALVVIAFGQKLGSSLLEDLPAFNLHASLLPAYRGAAPINRAMIDGCDETGVSVIALAQRMDAGVVYARRTIPIDPGATAGVLHDQLAELGPESMSSVLTALAEGRLEGTVQDEQAACPAPKLSRAEATVEFDAPAHRVRARIHGLTPWPGCDVTLGGNRLRLLRVRDRADAVGAPPGTLLEDGAIACAPGTLELLEVQPQGKKPMTFEAYRNGRSIPPGTLAESIS